MQTKIYTIKNKSEYETDFITNLLEAERIPYKLKPIKCYRNFFESPIIVGYDIELHTDFQHYEYFTRILYDELGKNGLNLTTSKTTTTITIIPLANICVQEYKPYKTVLKRIVDWFKNAKNR